MSSLGDLLLAHLKTNKADKVSDSDSCGDVKAEDSSHSVESSTTKVIPEHIVKNQVDQDAQSNASSTDDYVRELLDPDDRPRNVWHVVEGPKVQPVIEHEHKEDENKNRRQMSADENDISIQKTEYSSQASTDQPSATPYEASRDDDGPVGDKDAPIDNGESEERQRENHDDKRSNRTRDRRHDSRRDRSSEKSSSSRRNHHHDRERDRGSDHGRDRARRHRDDYDSDKRRSRRRHDYSDDDDDYDRHRSSHKDRRRSRSRSKASSRRRDRSRSDSQSPITKRNSRTILIMQLNPRVTSRDLEDFFSDIGPVREVRLIMDSKTRRHKGIAYIEFEDASSAAKAFSLNGQKFFGAPIVIQSAQMDRNRPSGEWHSSSSQIVNHASASHPSSRSNLPPNCYRVYVGGLHVNLTEEMIRSVFEPFGPIIRLELMRDRVTNVSRGYAFITYADIKDGQSAVQALDGFELGGKALRVSKSTDKSERHTATDSGGTNSGRGGGHHGSDSDGRSSRTKSLTASLYELAGH